MCSDVPWWYLQTCFSCPALLCLWVLWYEKESSDSSISPAAPSMVLEVREEGSWQMLVTLNPVSQEFRLPLIPRILGLGRLLRDHLIRHWCWVIGKESAPKLDTVSRQKLAWKPDLIFTSSHGLHPEHWAMCVSMEWRRKYPRTGSREWLRQVRSQSEFQHQHCSRNREVWGLNIRSLPGVTGINKLHSQQGSFSEWTWYFSAVWMDQEICKGEASGSWMYLMQTFKLFSSSFH